MFDSWLGISIFKNTIMPFELVFVKIGLEKSSLLSLFYHISHSFGFGYPRTLKIILFRGRAELSKLNCVLGTYLGRVQQGR